VKRNVRGGLLKFVLKKIPISCKGLPRRVADVESIDVLNSTPPAFFKQGFRYIYLASKAKNKH